MSFQESLSEHAPFCLSLKIWSTLSHSRLFCQRTKEAFAFAVDFEQSRNAMQTLIRTLDHLSEYVGRATAWLTSLLVGLIGIYVVMRYVFAEPRLWMQELEWHLFALIFLLGAAYTLKADAHVRVDVFYSRFHVRQQAWVNLIGTLVFLLPFCWVVVSRSWSFVESSWLIDERSSDPGGLPARYLIKAALPLSFLLLALQGVSEGLKALRTLTQTPSSAQTDEGPTA